jgi:hypothetical protein
MINVFSVSAAWKVYSDGVAVSFSGVGAGVGVGDWAGDGLGTGCRDAAFDGCGERKSEIVSDANTRINNMAVRTWGNERAEFFIIFLPLILRET